MSNIEAIAAALSAVESAHSAVKPEYEAYLESMKNSGNYEVVPGADEKRAGTALEMLNSGELTSKGITRAVESNLIRKIKVEQSESLKAKITAFNGALKDYEEVCRGAVLPFAIKATKARSGSSGGSSKVGQEVYDRARTVTLAYDEGAEFSFNDREMTVTFSNGKTATANVYNACFGKNEVPEKFLKALA